MKQVHDMKAWGKIMMLYVKKSAKHYSVESILHNGTLSIWRMKWYNVCWKMIWTTNVNAGNYRNEQIYIAVLNVTLIFFTFINLFLNKSSLPDMS